MVARCTSRARCSKRGHIRLERCDVFSPEAPYSMVENVHASNARSMPSLLPAHPAPGQAQAPANRPWPSAWMCAVYARHQRFIGLTESQRFLKVADLALLAHGFGAQHNKDRPHPQAARALPWFLGTVPPRGCAQIARGTRMHHQPPLTHQRQHARGGKDIIKAFRAFRCPYWPS